MACFFFLGIFMKPMSSATKNSLLVQSASAITAAFITWAAYTYLSYDTRWWWKPCAREKDKEVSHQPIWEEEWIRGEVSPG